MSKVDQAVGSVVEAGTLAPAVEPTVGECPGHTHETACLNCETPLVGAYCHECGQRGHVHRTLGAFFHDLLHGVLHFEGKFWRTLPLLVWRPGKLTRDYIDGKRARYVSPIALFLFVVFLSFALFNILGGDPVRVSDDQAAVSDAAAVTGAAAEAQADFASGFGLDSLPEESALAQAIAHFRENPQLGIYKVQTNAYKFSWMLIPLSVPFVWLLFPFSRRFRGYDHTVFVTYSIAFMIALFSLVSLLIYAGVGAGVLLLLYAPFHMSRQLRGTYAVSRWGAIWRTVFLSAVAWFAIAVFVGTLMWLATA